MQSDGDRIIKVRDAVIEEDVDLDEACEVDDIIEWLSENGFQADGKWFRRVGRLNKILKNMPRFPESLLLQKSFMSMMIAGFDFVDRSLQWRIFEVIETAVLASDLLYQEFMEMNATEVLISMLSITSDGSGMSQNEVIFHYVNAISVIEKIAYIEDSSNYLVESGILDAILNLPWADAIVVQAVLGIIGVFIRYHEHEQIAPLAQVLIEGTVRSWNIPEFAVRLGSDIIIPVLSDLCFKGFTGEVLSSVSAEEFANKLEMKEFESHTGAIARLLAQFVLYNSDIACIIPIDSIMMKLVSQASCSKLAEDLFVLIGAIAKQGMFMNLCTERTLEEFTRMSTEMEFNMIEHISTVLWIAFVGLGTYSEKMTLISAFCAIMTVPPNDSEIPELGIDDLIPRVLDGIEEIQSHGELDEPTCKELLEFLSNIVDDDEVGEQAEFLCTLLV